MAAAAVRTNSFRVSEDMCASRSCLGRHYITMKLFRRHDGLHFDGLVLECAGHFHSLRRELFRNRSAQLVNVVARDQRVDRKSTRLNSSHANITYADIS